MVLPDVLLILREAPVGDAKLELFWDRGVDLLHHLKRDVERYLLCWQLHQWNHLAIWRTPQRRGRLAWSAGLNKKDWIVGIVCILSLLHAVDWMTSANWHSVEQQCSVFLSSIWRFQRWKRLNFTCNQSPTVMSPCTDTTAGGQQKPDTPLISFFKERSLQIYRLLEDVVRRFLLSFVLHSCSLRRTLTHHTPTLL